MGKGYVIHFQLKLDSVRPGDYLSVLQMTTADKKDQKYGDRNPAVFVKGNKLHIASAINGDRNHHFDVPKALEAGKWYHVAIKQEDVERKSTGLKKVHFF